MIVVCFAFQLKEFNESCSTFVERFLERLDEMAVGDIDPDIATLAVQVFIKLQQ
jgi:hypothetical protein